MATVERVRITPNNITLKNSSGGIVFDTDRQYLKTGGGTLYAGGNTRAPVISGQSDIYDHTDYGGYTSGFFSTLASFNQAVDWTSWYSLPKCSSITMKYSEVWAVSTSPAYYYRAPNTRYVYYYNYNTGERLQTFTRFKWAVGRLNNTITGEWYDGVWPEFLDTFSPITAAAGGRLDLEWSANEHLNYTNTVSGTDNYNNYYSNTYRASDYLTGTLKHRFHGPFITRDPVALSLAITP